MDLRDLRYFETIAELQHLGRATHKLHRSQPALTSSVRRLEAACGAALFEKAGRGIRLGRDVRLSGASTLTGAVSAGGGLRVQALRATEELAGSRRRVQYLEGAGGVARRFGPLLRRFAQGAAEAQNARIRRHTVDSDNRMEQALAFAGRGE